MLKTGEAIVLCGFALWIAGQIWLALRAFQRSRFWGLSVLFIPLAGLAFVVGRWRFSRAPFLVYLSGIGLMVVGGLLLSGEKSTLR